MSSNQIDGNGIQIQSYADILAAITAQMKQIYGSDINLDQNSPDGQLVNILVLSKQDVLDLIVQDYAAKDPDQAVGVALDGVAQLCGLTRKGGTYTETSITVVTDRSLNLFGLDSGSTPFTVSDSVGNLFYLKSSVSLAAGSHALDFRAADIGFIQVTQNTITVIATTVLGVLSVNNPDVPYSIGEDQETDAQFRLRRQAATARPSEGWLQSLLGELYNIAGLAEAVIYENNTNATDLNLVPAHSIWVIVDGGSSADVAQAIYTKRNAGCGMTGAITEPVVQVDGSTFNTKFDRAAYQDLYIHFSLTSISGNSIDEAAITAGLIAQYLLGIYDPADISSITTIIKGLNPDLVVSGCEVSVNGTTWTDLVLPSAKKNKFVLTTEKITIIPLG